MQPFQKEQTDGILSKFLHHAESHGFRKKRKDRFIRSADDCIVQGIDVHFMKRYGELHVTPSLMIQHYEIGSLISEALSRHLVVEDRRQREYDATLDISPIKFILARQKQTGAISDYTIPSLNRMDEKISCMLSDLDDVMDEYFDAQESLSSTISYFEREKRAGGTAHDLKLLALYYHVGRFDELRKFAASLNEDNAAPITLSMKGFLLAKLGDISPDEPELDKTPHNDLPVWPSRLSRDERKSFRNREKQFLAALKGKVRGSGWRFARGTIFRQEGDWFISNMPSLAFEGGVVTRWICKPMAIDALFWDITGLRENERQPLSFRDQGAWTVRPLSLQEFIAREETDPDVLADAILEWSDNRRTEWLPRYSMSAMLSELGDINNTAGMQRTIAVCLSILLKNFDQAERLCNDPAPERDAFSKDSGGFTTSGAGGRSVTFFEQARNWISRNRAAT